MTKKCKSGFKRKKGKCVRTSSTGLFKGFRERSFGQRVLTLLAALLIAIFIALAVTGFLEIGFLVALRPIWKILIGIVGLIIVVIIFRGILNIKKR